MKIKTLKPSPQEELSLSSKKLKLTAQNANAIAKSDAATKDSIDTALLLSNAQQSVLLKKLNSPKAAVRISTFLSSLPLLSTVNKDWLLNVLAKMVILDSEEAIRKHKAQVFRYLQDWTLVLNCCKVAASHLQLQIQKDALQILGYIPGYEREKCDMLLHWMERSIGLEKHAFGHFQFVKEMQVLRNVFLSIHEERDNESLEFPCYLKPRRLRSLFTRVANVGLQSSNFAYKKDSVIQLDPNVISHDCTLAGIISYLKSIREK